MKYNHKANNIEDAFCSSSREVALLIKEIFDEFVKQVEKEPIDQIGKSQVWENLRNSGKYSEETFNFLSFLMVSKALDELFEDEGIKTLMSLQKIMEEQKEAGKTVTN